ncbi:aminomethyltransferase, mitochondrial [Bacillus rossius redtenbacheri]|uniref:aminomethyltransferase, mitochondrial n=1 Tax=Bacillus rossius redtenbacheri TaxID=93214 RepID=UPI002FDD5BCA
MLRWLRRASSQAGPAASRHEEPRRSCLHEFHVARGGRMVPFAGFLLPLSYGAEGVAASHRHTRAHCSLFDVSHMLQTEVRGRHRLEFLESLCPADLRALPDNRAALSVFTHPITGGILDDLVVTRTSLGFLHVVTNAGRRAADRELLERRQAEFRAGGKDVELVFLEPEERALLAVQGPDTERALRHLVDVDLRQLRFMGSTLARLGEGPRCRLTRCGYTGEDGVEVSLGAGRAAHVLEALLESDPGRVRLAGLGARDSLRLEAGFCLYGSDIDHTTTPVEAGLSWLIAKRRREAADFPGAQVILRQLKEGPSRRRVGLRASMGPPVRAGARILNEGDEVVGYVTSGGPSPTLGVNIAMGYVQSDCSAKGTRLRASVRGKTVDLEVCRLPFVPRGVARPCEDSEGPTILAMES